MLRSGFVGDKSFGTAAQEEAEAVTGIADPEASATHILERPGALTEWCIIKLGSHGALLCSKSPLQHLKAPAFQVLDFPSCSEECLDCRIAVHCWYSTGLILEKEGREGEEGEKRARKRESQEVPLHPNEGSPTEIETCL